MRDLSYNYGLTIFDIRDYFTSSYIEEYESLILRAREEFNNILKNCYVPPYLPRSSDGGDGCPHGPHAPNQSSDFIQHMEKLLGKDYSYLYFGVENKIKMDNEFLMDCVDYFNKNDIDETYTNDDIPELNTLSGGLYHVCIFNQTPINKQILEYLLMSDTINIKLMQELSSEPLNHQVDEKRHKYLNVFEKNTFMPIHNDIDNQDIRFVCINYPNIDRKVSDGSIFRYYIDNIPSNPIGFRYTEGVSLTVDVLTNYTKVIVLDYNKCISDIKHLVTKNNVKDVKYSLHNTYRKDQLK